MIHPSTASRAFALVVALISGLSSSFGMVMCKQPNGNSELEIVPARQSTCVSCDGHDHHAPDTRRDGEPGMSRATLHESCPCSDALISGGLSSDRLLLRNAAAEKVAEVVGNALPLGDNEPLLFVRSNASRKCLFVPPRPDPLIAFLRATVRLI